MSRILVIAGLALLTQVGMAQGLSPHKGELLSDAQLDRVTAGGVSAETGRDGVVNFQGSAMTGKGLVSASGNLRQMSSPSTSNSTGSINLSGSAQQNLSSIVNFNAVNSIVSVNMNLVVNIDSSIGKLTQLNMGGKQ